jgi:hypothetical protein
MWALTVGRTGGRTRWNRFRDIADVKILPWRSSDSDTQKGLIPDNKIGGKMLDVLFSLEDRFPDFFVKHFQYPMIILTKRTSPRGATSGPAFATPYGGR